MQQLLHKNGFSSTQMGGWAEEEGKGELSAPAFHSSFHGCLADDPSHVAETLGKLHRAS